MGLDRDIGTGGSPVIKIIFRDTEEYAKELFRVLRLTEKSEADIIIAQRPDESGIGLALETADPRFWYLTRSVYNAIICAASGA